MKEFLETEAFTKWFDALRDRRARVRIVERLRRLSGGNPGDVKAVGEGVSELRIDYGSGYRVYFWDCGNILIILLCGGDKATQDRDIKRAKILAREFKEHRS
ncbi:type II toxin-antitoxin system RelE/ParE family toxin [Phyllobacterium sp. 628]|uniref:type II toxin-antitoxin system RelE/ParE family toxin n=1 Tax=Phyllobacterium sp. 628 TaxID=2718938 RepID=UPI0016626A9C|nr:type II toxin-antitoxin system RelE/ParE family toxin [Phyllobacterium sp. 628]QND52556.1 type II toxin-antitoxin system RelE/ParE family toxin [Phyllobacterium sp. 628]